VPESILDKPGPLTPEERAIMELLTIVGEQVLAPVAFLAGVRPLVRHEHERWDGAGYPGVRCRSTRAAAGRPRTRVSGVVTPRLLV
jgi:hypothetical protein